jgi:hypothetical protein
MIYYDDLNEAELGIASVWNPDGTRIDRMVYSAEQIIQIYQKRDNMTEEQAIEFIEFNTDGSYLGEQTPIIVWKNYDK